MGSRTPPSRIGPFPEHTSRPLSLATCLRPAVPAGAGDPPRRSRHGRAAGWLIGADWEALLREPVAQIRAHFNIKPPSYYGPVLEAARKLIARQQAAMAAGD